MTGLEIIIGTVIGFVLGRFMPARKKRFKEPKPICGCKHHYSMHDPKTGVCHSLMYGAEVAVRDKNGNVVKENGYIKTISEKVPCGCRVYTGPEPLPLIISRELGL